MILNLVNMAGSSSQHGFFKVHYVDGKYFFEIADSLFGRDILIVNRVVKAPVDAQKRKVGYPGDYISDEVIRFEKGHFGLWGIASNH